MKALPKAQRIRCFKAFMAAGYVNCLLDNKSDPAAAAFYLGIPRAHRLVPFVFPKYEQNREWQARARYLSGLLTDLVGSQRFAGYGFDAFMSYDVRAWTSPLLACPWEWALDITNRVTSTLNHGVIFMADTITPHNATESVTIPPEVMSRLNMELASLEQALLNKDPLMPQHLRNSHALLLQYPETVHLLDERDAVGLIIKALQAHTNIEIVKATIAKPRAASSRAAKVDASDL